MKTSGNGAKVAISPAQVRAARALLGWSQDQLVEASGIPKRTLVRFEVEDGSPQARTIAAIRSALEVAGVIFVDENGEGAGVRRRKGLACFDAASLSEKKQIVADEIAFLKQHPEARRRTFVSKIPKKK